MLIYRSGERFMVATYSDDTAALIPVADPPYEFWTWAMLNELMAVLRRNAP